MKALQNNFTTPEQSKRLLELGVPADSADCYLMKCKYIKDIYIPKILYDVTYSQLDKFTNVLDYLPCWSVGRLIVIYELCSGKIYERKPARLAREGNVSVMKELTIIEDIIGDIRNARLYIYPHMDFSKLEE